MVRSAKSPTLTVVKDLTATPESNGPDLETYHFHKGVIVQMQARVDAAKKLLKTARRGAQDAGLVLRDLDLVLRMSEEEPETVQANIRRLAQYAEWEGLAPGFQADFFEKTNTVDPEKNARLEGYKEGIEGRTAEGERYDPGNPIGAARLDGWRSGQKVLADRFTSKSEAASDEA